MSKFSLALVAIGLCAIGVFGLAKTEAVSAAEACNIAIVDGPSNRGIKVSADGKTASSTLIVSGDCRDRYATLTAWIAPNNTNGRPFSAQKYFKHTTIKVKPGRQTFSVALPQCEYWQVDLLGQKRPKSIYGDANYQWPQDKLANFKLGGKKCPQNKDIEIVKDASVSKAKVGEFFDYTINVKNTGNVKLTNVKVTDRLPEGIVAADKPDDREIMFTVDELKIQETKSFTIRAKVLDSVKLDTVLNNIACVVTKELPKEECDDATITVSKETVPVDGEGGPEEAGVETLPSTGPAEAIAAIGGTSAMAGAARMYLRGRKDLIRNILGF